ncbi:IS66 family transposase [Parageobacillus thermoglucosidasius]|uniref:IS66 family transposase n=1 Tax=Parageobacillus thermoglucosidasius TaxID=1426 RepID=UPI003B67FDF6
MKSCPCCGRLEQAEFPPDVTHHVQYGRRIRALVAYLHTVQLLLSARLVQLLEEWLDAPISEGSIYNIVQESAARLEELREPIQEKLLASPILHADETSLSVQGKRHWLHVAGTSEATWLFCHPKRGREAMEAIGLLPGIGEPSCTMHGAIFSVHRGGTRPVQRPLVSRAAVLARSASAGLGETLKRPVA